MITVGNAVISDDIAENQFVCDLQKCKGACCEEGEYGAPLEDDELETLEMIYVDIEDFLSEEGKKEIAKSGKYGKDPDGEYSTPVIKGRECAYAVRTEDSKLQCGIENAYKAGRTTFRKPISCQLYPIRITKYDHYDALNYHRWHICNPACELGQKLSMPIYKFVKDALVRKYGREWYRELQEQVQEKYKDQK